MAEENNSKWQLLSRLRTVVKKVTFLLNPDVNRWRYVSSFFGGSNSRRRLSFGQGLGLTTIVSSSSSDEEEGEEEDKNVGFCDDFAGSSRMLEKTKSFSVQRSMSFIEEDDLDKRAEMFIENFYRQLRLERQVSLQLRYKRGTSFGSSLSNSP